MSPLFDSLFVQQIGMTLLHSLWQAAVVAVAFAIIHRLLARNSANLRYAVAYASLLVMFALTCLTLAWLSSSQGEFGEPAVAAPRQLRYVTADVEVAEAESAALPPSYGAVLMDASAETPRTNETADTRTGLDAIAPPREAELPSADIDRLRWLLPWLSLGWAIGVLAFSLRPLVALFRCRQFKSQAKPVEVPAIVDAFRSLCDRMGLHRKVDLASSALVHIPTVVGFLRPIVLLPISMLTGQSPHELSSIIAHELAHVRRHDYLMNLAQTAIETLLFYHPAVWCVSAVVRQERENCCDDIAMALCGRKNYANALANLEFARTRQTSLALGADGGSLYRRIRRIVRPHENPNPAGRWLAAIVAMAALLLGTFAVLPHNTTAVAADGDSTEPNVESLVDAGSVSSLDRIHGQLVDADGAGIGGTVHVVSKQSGHVTQPGTEQVLHSVHTDSDGHFDFSMKLPSRDDFVDRGVWGAAVLQLVGTANGYGPTAVDVIDVRKGNSAELRLPKDDQAVEGEIRTLEGEPVVGASIRVAILDCSSDIVQRLESVRQQAKEEKPGQMMVSYFAVQDFLEPGYDLDSNERIVANKLHHSQFAPDVVQTDANGRFRLTGVGRDRMLALELSGPGIVKSWISVATRDMEPIKAPLFIGARTRITYGAKFTYSAEPSRAVVGKITDVESGEPIAGVRVESGDSSGATVYVSALTDESGTYRLEGLPKSQRSRLNIQPPQNAPYFARRYVEVTDTASGLRPARADFQLRRTEWYYGRVVDKVTGEPVQARVVYSPRVDNENTEQFPAFVKGRFSSDAFLPENGSVGTDENGLFRIQVIRGDGMLFIRCNDQGYYCTAFGRESLDPKSKWWGERREYESQRMTNTYQPMFPEWVHRLAAIQVGGLDRRIHKITVDPGQSLRARLIDPDGKRLTDVRVVGRLARAMSPSERPTTTDRITIPAITANNPRPVFFYHKDRNLGAFLLVPDASSWIDNESDTADEATIRLQPCGTVKARLLDRDGKPMAGVPVSITPVGLKDPSQRFVVGHTDQQGRFEASRVIPSTDFQFIMNSSPGGATIGQSVHLNPGEVLDLGDVELDTKAPDRTTPNGFTSGEVNSNPESNEVDQSQLAIGAGDSNDDATPPTTRSKGDKLPASAERTYEGKVLDPTGKPLAGVRISAENLSFDPDVGRLVGRELKSTVTAADGSYLLTFQPQDGGNQLVAAKSGFGPAVLKYERLQELFEAGESKFDLQLVNDQPITGRVVDTEGNPLEGVTIEATQIVVPSSDEAVNNWIENEQPHLFAGHDRGSVMMSNDSRIRETAFPGIATIVNLDSVAPPIETDARGTFRLSGIGANRLIHLSLSGPTIAKKQTIVVTRKMENIVAFSHWVRNRDYTHHGASPTIVTSPTQLITGRVVDSTTRSPLAGVSVRLARSGASDWLGSSSTIVDTTDADGRFRLLGAPLGGQHVVEVEPSVEAPYFTTKRELPVASGSAPLECDFELPRARWISGRVTNASGIPVAAILEFYPFRDNAHAETYKNFEQRITGSTPDELFHTDDDGQFRVKAIPGPAVLAAVVKDHAQRQNYVLNCDAELFERIGGERMSRLFNSWSAEYFDAIIEVNVSESDTNAKQNLVVKLGGKRLVKITDEAGEPLSEVHSLGRTFPPRYQREVLMQNSTLEVIGLKPNETRTVVLLQRDRKVGKVLTVGGDSTKLVDVCLVPCANVAGRIVDIEGNGVGNVSLRVSPIIEPPTDNWGRRLEGAQTNADGRFHVLLPTGCKMRVSSYSQTGPNVTATFDPQPGVTYELGDLKHNDELDVEDTSKIGESRE